ncbi:MULTISPECIES: hypothetical protein [Fusobacterium]|jgi:hypothetical protein|uniref:Uncharacterized protein n=1 Tax=Fusobacterium varium ATCC 27725 TaxID=469618 RepID=A0ABN5JH08_FUSVA|nr:MULTISPECIES: hypothetical protein [Fusobacterium]AVQ30078.1 hypothetical protein C4N18_02095 [Fusobacterium varium ATCC 27725]EES64904.1 hypothetical protein FVAG_01587 [Fusobacterium varium ATCC 27725]MCI6032069.1 hypothetical protein [Fusobacterium varium]MDY4005550.1 hypothetical protein [Fusobacterium varium]OFL85867.1 hypothetical protein HMPREF2747_02750 [Fusobacterium sp. HMSC073F01]
METKKNAKVETAEKKKVKVKKYRFLDSKYKKEDYDFLEKYFKILKKKYKTNGKVVVKLFEFYEKHVAVQNKDEK